MNESNPSDEILAELLTLTREVDSDGTIRYLNSEGKEHRVYGPAMIFDSGAEYWCHNGELHRVCGPAVIYPDGAEWWYQRGQKHREDGPAAIYPGGEPRWYLHGDRMSEWEWKRLVNKMSECDQPPVKRDE